MTAKFEEKKAELIDKVVSHVRKKLHQDQVPQIEAFARQYYSRVAPEDLIERSILDLYGAVLAHWNFACQRIPGAPKIRVYNPNFEEHGWQSTHTIVEIVNDDMPFLVDSVNMALNRHGLTIHLVIHPVMNLRRDTEGRLIEVLSADAATGGVIHEALLHVEVDRQTAPAVLEEILADLERVLSDVRKAAEDWAKMRERVNEILAELDKNPPLLSQDEISEAKAFLQWINDNHFTFLGYREYDLLTENGEDILRIVPGSGCGILREVKQTSVSQSFAILPPEVRKLARARQLLIITKANSRATVHRPTYIDYIGIKRFDASGEVIGERRFLGLYTSAAYNTNPRDIPLLRQKVMKVMARSLLRPASHAGKVLMNILETLPRDELFQANEDELFETAMGILHLQERQRIRLFARRDTYDRFFSCIVYVPRDRYNTELRERMQDILQKAFNGVSVEFTTLLSESVLARIHFIIRTISGNVPVYDVKEIEGRLIEATRSWKDDLREALIEKYGEERGNALFRRYADAFPAGYREDFSARTSVFDIEHMETLTDAGGLGMSFYRPLEEPERMLRFKLFQPQHPIPLSDVLPMLENMSLKVIEEHPYEIEPRKVSSVWIHDFSMIHAQGLELELDQVKDIFQDAFAHIWRGEVEDDGFNRLVLGAELTWRETVLLRAYCKYLLQTRIPFSQAYMEQSLAGNPTIARLLVRLFNARLNPTEQKKTEVETKRLIAEIEDALDLVPNLDEDRILRHFLNAIQATSRTNYFQKCRDGRPRPYLSFKFDPPRIPELPLPWPMFEIFVYSPQTEAIHMRGGKVARGGLRWSDRREDFRTEILSLMKTQTVKNAVIVPVGAKGGFVLKRPPTSGGAMLEEAIACYRTFIRGMLDLTDNIVSGRVIPPADVVRYDEDDPYLVLAADKGTATFSDIANAVAKEYSFWLGDAFASGGSTGYDHKKIGITSRGVWESVKRHFREIGIDIQSTDFTIVGIGDMSGDVFGNGMLLSRHIMLIGAFNHQHIFLDPNPNPDMSYKERERLFKLPHSSWSDYDSKLISKGGGVFPRTAKSIRLSSEVKNALSIEVDALTPNELIRALLKAPVDLLWNGGIGMFVKGSFETNIDVGDRTNDGIRVNANELRCQVIGEGGNLGLTQLGRIEYALNWGRINTDFIDNSGGVDCSDHEVNIKILLNAVIANGDMTEKQRNEILAEMTDEVTALVLRDNYWQAQAISITEVQAHALLDEHARFTRNLEKAGMLDRALEYLPSDDVLVERQAAGKGLTRPEIAVLLAYSKITLYKDLLASDVAEDPYLSNDLERYFPTPLRERFRREMQNHRLRREIIATFITNSMVNRMGATFAHQLREEVGTAAPDITRAYTIAREVFDMRRLWTDIEALDHRVAADIQIGMMIEGQRLIRHTTVWLLRNRLRPLDISATVSYFAPGVADLSKGLPKLLLTSDRAALKNAVKRLVSAGVPAEIANQVASLDAMFPALDIVEVASTTGFTVEDVAAVYFTLGERLELHWLRDQITALPVQNHWQDLAKTALYDELYGQQRALTAKVLQMSPKTKNAETCIDAWLAQNRALIERCLQVFADLKAGGTIELAMLSVALRELHSLVQSGESSVPITIGPSRSGQRTVEV
ncbi:MAG: NAD-glutamate dehydrogenase [Thermodesulfobacteriota bacterium]